MVLMDDNGSKNSSNVSREERDGDVRHTHDNPSTEREEKKRER